MPFQEKTEEIKSKRSYKNEDQLSKYHNDVKKHNKMQYQTAADEYIPHDVTGAFELAKERKVKEEEFKKTNFSFGFHNRHHPRTAFGSSRKSMHKKYLNKANKISQNGSAVSVKLA